MSTGRPRDLQVPQQPSAAPVSLCPLSMPPSHLLLHLLTSPSPPRELPHSAPALLLEPGLHELQLELLSRFDPDHLLLFLQTSQQYRLEEAVQVRLPLRLSDRRVSSTSVSVGHLLVFRSGSSASSESRSDPPPLSSVDHSKVPSQQGHGLPAGEEGRRPRSFCCPAGGHQETFCAFVKVS